MPYKLTDSMMRSFGGFGWQSKVWYKEELGPFCRAGGFHYYPSPEFAALFHPVHIAVFYDKHICWKIKVGGKKHHQFDKSKAEQVMLVEQVKMPEFTKEQLIYLILKVEMLHPTQTIHHNKTIYRAYSTFITKTFISRANDWIKGKRIRYSLVEEYFRYKISNLLIRRIFSAYYNNDILALRESVALQIMNNTKVKRRELQKLLREALRWQDPCLQK